MHLLRFTSRREQPPIDNVNDDYGQPETKKDADEIPRHTFEHLAPIDVATES